MEGHLYLVCRLVDGQPIGPCKVGVTKSLKSRLAGLQTGSPERLIYYELWPEGPGVEIMEKRIHEILHDKRLLGEWFNIAPEDTRDWIEIIISLYTCKLLHDSGDDETDIEDLAPF